MAMRKEPERRYSSVEQFAADIERYLDGMPVLARADAWTYRAGKFLRATRSSSRCRAAFVALLIGFTVTTYMQSERIAQRARRRAGRARARADERAARRSRVRRS